jgi:hypothetical protein
MICGGRPQYRGLPADERAAVIINAKVMYELGVDFTTAYINEGSTRSGFVYVITNKAWPDYVKIGRAFDPKQRLKDYQTGCPKRDYELYAAVYFKDCFMAEKEIHARLEESYRNGALGEWYNISPLLARHEINKLRSVL